MNLYHTRSSMIVNGREAHLFTADHKDAVGKVLTVQNLDSIDQELREVLLRELDKIQIPSLNPQLPEPVKANVTGLQSQLGSTIPNSYNTQPPVPNTVRLVSHSLPQKPVHDSPSQTPTDTDLQLYVCAHCNMPSVDNAIKCSVCCNWFHYMCESMSREEFDRHCDDLNASYLCLSCMVGSMSQKTGANYPIQCTYHHEGTDAKSQTDYWFLSAMDSEVVTVGERDPINLSDHVEVSPHTKYLVMAKERTQSKGH